jgi:hypothetical protein
MDRTTAFIQPGYIDEIIAVIEQLVDDAAMPAIDLKQELARQKRHTTPLSINEANRFLSLAYEQLAMPHLGLVAHFAIKQPMLCFPGIAT